jgi:hypothetical protein
MLERLEKEFLYYAITMANKYNNAEAHYHVYAAFARSTAELPKKALELLDENSKNYALYYLIKSHELGYGSAKYQLYEIFGKGQLIPKSSTYLQKLCLN